MEWLMEKVEMKGSKESRLINYAGVYEHIFFPFSMRSKSVVWISDENRTDAHQSSESSR